MTQVRNNIEHLFEKLDSLPLIVKGPVALLGVAAATAATFPVAAGVAGIATAVGLIEAGFDVPSLYVKIRNRMYLPDKNPKLPPKAQHALHLYHWHTAQATKALNTVLAEYNN